MIPLHPDVRAFVGRRQGARIGGREVFAELELDVLDPSSGRHLATVSACGRNEVDLAVAAAQGTFDRHWRDMLPDDRVRRLWRMAELIDERGEILAQIDALDNGKPFAKARDVDVPWSARHLRYFAGWPDKIEGSVISVNLPDRLNYTRVEPIGVCGLIAPWNYPLLMAMWKLAPALAAGNTVILKPSEETPLSALMLSDLALEAGLPEGVLNIVPGTGPHAGEALVAHPGVGKIGFTGSTATGRRIAQTAAGSVKRVSLELGGKAANIIFADADFEVALPGAFWAAFGNNGQSCTAGSRLYVHRSVHDRVVAGLAEMASQLSVGPGLDTPGHDLGPVISERQMQKVLGFVGRAEGADVVCGGKRMERAGWFVPPTIVTNVADSMEIVREEAFGPLVAVMCFDDDAEVVDRANETPYGLAAGIWTRDVSRARRMAEQLQAGTVWINCWGETDAASPFGGIRQSGYGREMGREAIALYSQTKSIWVA